ncbi:hypothetical protein AMTRI_Chr13g122850 [Amborella trichopoda]
MKSRIKKIGLFNLQIIFLCSPIRMLIFGLKCTSETRKIRKKISNPPLSHSTPIKCIQIKHQALSLYAYQMHTNKAPISLSPSKFHKNQHPHHQLSEVPI